MSYAKIDIFLGRLKRQAVGVGLMQLRSIAMKAGCQQFNLGTEHLQHLHDVLSISI